MARIMGEGLSFEDVLIRPKYNTVTSRTEVTFDTKVTRNISLKIPFIAANMDTICGSDMAIAIGKLGGLGVIHRFMSIEEQFSEVKKVKKKGLVAAAAIGIKDYKERVRALDDTGVDIIVVDIAHGHSKYAGQVISWLKENYSVEVIAGNVGTKDATDYLISKGIDGIKVGIGPGKVCTTRQITGCGVPQLSAIMEVYESTKGKIPIIADGGIRKPGDVAKALGAGADTIMAGYIFAGCDETPNIVNYEWDTKVPEYSRTTAYRGSASEGTKGEAAFVEGTTIGVERKGPVNKVVNKYLQGLASAMTYNGKRKLKNYIGDVDFMRLR